MKSETDVVERAVTCLRDGGVVLVPTDTVYGLAVHPERPEAAERLFALKRRPKAVNLPIMVASPERLPMLGVRITEPARRLLAAFVPGCLTLALGVSAAAAPGWLLGRREVAVRIPREDVLTAILSAAGPLLVTSANLHTQPTEETVESILSELGDRPDLIIDGGRRTSVPSTLVNCNLPAPIVERVGAISREEIERVLR
jgi:L-threonylcarbamoyladenylate synthase